MLPIPCDRHWLRKRLQLEQNQMQLTKENVLPSSWDRHNSRKRLPLKQNQMQYEKKKKMRSSSKIWTLQKNTNKKVIQEKHNENVFKKILQNLLYQMKKILHFPKDFKNFAKFLEKMGYQIFAFIPTHLYQIISDFPKHTHPPNRLISYVDGP